MSEQTIPECLVGIYSKLGEWKQYDMKTGYEKRCCMIITNDGRKIGPCFANAGRFHLLEEFGPFESIPEKFVNQVAYFQP